MRRICNQEVSRIWSKVPPIFNIKEAENNQKTCEWLRVGLQFITYVAEKALKRLE